MRGGLGPAVSGARAVVTLQHPDREGELEVRLSLLLAAYELDVEFRSQARVLGVFGPSGSGKTSLLEAVAGLRRRARGRVVQGKTVWLDSSAGHNLAPESRGVGYVPQDGLLFPHRTVRQNLEAGIRFAQAPAGLFDRVVELFELSELLERYPVSLSGGERQRVALGRALGSVPRLLILDEPLASLDLSMRRRMLAFLRGVQREFDVPWLFVSHDPFECQALCDELIALRRGRIVRQGPTRDVLTDPEVYGMPSSSLAPDGIVFDNLLEGRLTRHERDTSHVCLQGVGAIEVVTRRMQGDVGERVWVDLPAQEVILALSEVSGLSARNVLAATVQGVRRGERVELVTLTLGGSEQSVTVEVTEATRRRFALESGQDVFVIFKANSCRAWTAG